MNVDSGARLFIAGAWFWTVAGDPGRYWSSAAGAYVPVLPAAAGLSLIGSEQELTDVLAVYGLPGPIARPYRVYRVQFVERLTPEEATTLEAALDAAGPKLRLMYQSVDYFLSDDPLFAVLHWTVASALGSEATPNFARADALLAPSD